MMERSPTFRQFSALIRSRWEASGLWGTALAYNKASVRALRDAVLQMLDDPASTRASMRQRLALVAKQIEDWGPDAPEQPIPVYTLPIDEPGAVVAPHHWEDK